jgi:hypothetical protein
MPEEKTSDDLTGRKILLKAHDACCETLLQLSSHFNVRLPMEGLQGLRISILIATAIKAVNSSHAIRLLCVERPYFEEMNILDRSLIESIVNGAFLQFATDEELTAFENFDTIALSKALRIAETISPEGVDLLSRKLRDEFRQHSDSVKTMIGKDEKEFSWTRLDVVAKGDRIDKGLGRQAFEPLCKVLFPNCHAFVHGSYRSLEAYMPSETRKLPEDFLDFQADGALHTMNVALLCLCITMNHFSTVRQENQLLVIQGLLVAFSDQVRTSFPQAAARAAESYRRP